MQLTNEAALEDKTNGAPASVASEMGEGLNGGSSAELHELLGALQAMRVGDFSQISTAIRDPLTGQPFPDKQIPLTRISSVSPAPAASAETAGRPERAPPRRR